MTEQKKGTIIVDGKTEEIDVRTFPDNVEPAKATVGLKATVNLGNYENAQAFVSVTLPCYEEEVEAALDEAEEIADNKISEVLKEIKNG